MIYKEITSWASRNAFPKWQEGRHPHCHFRGLLRLHSRYGPPDRSAAHRRPLSRGSNPCGYPHEPLVSYRINRQRGRFAVGHGRRSRTTHTRFRSASESGPSGGGADRLLRPILARYRDWPKLQVAMLARRKRSPTAWTAWATVQDHAHTHHPGDPAKLDDHPVPASGGHPPRGPAGTRQAPRGGLSRGPDTSYMGRPLPSRGGEVGPQLAPVLRLECTGSLPRVMCS